MAPSSQVRKLEVEIEEKLVKEKGIETYSVGKRDLVYPPPPVNILNIVNILIILNILNVLKKERKC